MFNYRLASILPSQKYKKILPNTKNANYTTEITSIHQLSTLIHIPYSYLKYLHSLFSTTKLYSLQLLQPSEKLSIKPFQIQDYFKNFLNHTIH